MPHIAIDGPTGVGKSTTSRLLADRLGAPLLLDPVSTSPLLDDYYDGSDSADASLAAELTFLRLRAELVTRPADAPFAIADFTVARTGPFSEFLDRTEDRARVQAAMSHALSLAERPAALVLLSAEPSTLLERVRQRARDAEVELTIEHLESLTAHFADWRDTLVAQSDLVIELDTESWDPHDSDDLDALLGLLAPTLP